MGTIAAGIVARLKQAVPVTDLVGNRIATATQARGLVRPYLIFHVIGARDINSNHGATGLRRGLVQLTCYADGSVAAWEVATAVKAALRGAWTAGGTRVQSCFLDDERDAPQPPEPGAGQSLPGVVQVYSVAADE